MREFHVYITLHPSSTNDEAGCLCVFDATDDYERPVTFPPSDDKLADVPGPHLRPLLRPAPLTARVYVDEDAADLALAAEAEVAYLALTEWPWPGGGWQVASDVVYRVKSRDVSASRRPLSQRAIAMAEARIAAEVELDRRTLLAEEAASAWLDESRSEERARWLGGLVSLARRARVEAFSIYADMGDGDGEFVIDGPFLGAERQPRSTTPTPTIDTIGLRWAIASGELSLSEAVELGAAPALLLSGGFYEPVFCGRRAWSWSRVRGLVERGLLEWEDLEETRARITSDGLAHLAGPPRQGDLFDEAVFGPMTKSEARAQAKAEEDLKVLDMAKRGRLRRALARGSDYNLGTPRWAVDSVIRLRM